MSSIEKENYSQHGSPVDVEYSERTTHRHETIDEKPQGSTSSFLLRRLPYLPESNSNVISRAHDDVRPELHFAIAPISVDAVVFLQHSDDCVADFCECELLANADARSAVEREILCMGISVLELWPPQKMSMECITDDSAEIKYN